MYFFSDLLPEVLNKTIFTHQICLLACNCFPWYGQFYRGHANTVVCLPLVLNESFLSDIFFFTILFSPIPSFFDCFFMVVQSRLILSAALAFLVFRPNYSPVPRSATVVTAVTRWNGLDTENAVKCGKTRIGQVEIRVNSAVPSRNGRVLNHWM